MLRHIFTASRFMILIPIAGSFVTAFILLVYGAADTIQLISKVITLGEVGTKGAKTLTLAAIEVVDLYLLGAALYLIALGLYELFIDDTLPLPHWLEIHDFDDLKAKLVGVIILVLAVIFLGQAINWDGKQDLLGFGAAIALVIGALSYYLSQKSKKSSSTELEE